MRIDVVSDNPAEGLVKAMGLVPSPMILGFWGMGVCRCLIAGVRLDVFETLLKRQPESADTIAEQTGCDPDGMESLLNALAGFGYVLCKNGKYSLSRISRKWLVSDSKYSLCDSILMLADLWDRFGNLEETIKTGQTPDFHDPGQSPEFWKRYIRGLAAMARFSSSLVIRKIKFPKPPARLLDIGGGHGLFSVEMCKKYPALTADVIDLEPAARQGRQIVKEAGYEDKVRFVEGDFHSTSWGSGYDVVLLFNVIHNTASDQVPHLFEKAFRALDDHGSVIVLDAQHTGCSRKPSCAGGFSELFFYVVNGTRAYPEKTIRNWMENAGFTFSYQAGIRVLQEILIAGKKLP